VAPRLTAKPIIIFCIAAMMLAAFSLAATAPSSAEFCISLFTLAANAIFLIFISSWVQKTAGPEIDGPKDKEAAPAAPALQKPFPTPR
jgi:hypothetical protein